MITLYKRNEVLNRMHPHLADPISLGFHYNDGVYFKRHRSGSVQITILRENKINSPVEHKIIIQPDEWASIIASVSAKSETNESWKEANHFHMESKNE